MSAREVDPLRLDVAAFAKEGGELEGAWPLTDLPRVAETVPAGTLLGPADSVRWSAHGELRPMRGGAPQVWLHLRADARVPLQCQRCLQAVVESLQIGRSLMFVQGEDAAAQLDADSEDDVLALTRALDLRELVEDELLLAMPIVPRHDVCPEPLVAADAGDATGAEEAPHPFAALAALKRSLPN